MAQSVRRRHSRSPSSDDCVSPRATLTCATYVAALEMRQAAVGAPGRAAPWGWVRTTPVVDVNVGRGAILAGFLTDRRGWQVVPAVALVAALGALGLSNLGSAGSLADRDAQCELRKRAECDRRRFHDHGIARRFADSRPIGRGKPNADARPDRLTDRVADSDADARRIGDGHLYGEVRRHPVRHRDQVQHDGHGDQEPEPSDLEHTSCRPGPARFPESGRRIDGLARSVPGQR